MSTLTSTVEDAVVGEPMMKKTRLSSHTEVRKHPSADIAYHWNEIKSLISSCKLFYRLLLLQFTRRTLVFTSILLPQTLECCRSEKSAIIVLRTKSVE